jgi:hypothetical protein
MIQTAMVLHGDQTILTKTLQFISENPTAFANVSNLTLLLDDTEEKKEGSLIRNLFCQILSKSGGGKLTKSHVIPPKSFNKWYATEQQKHTFYMPSGYGGNDQVAFHLGVEPKDLARILHTDFQYAIEQLARDLIPIILGNPTEVSKGHILLYASLKLIKGFVSTGSGLTSIQKLVLDPLSRAMNNYPQGTPEHEALKKLTSGARDCSDEVKTLVESLKPGSNKSLSMDSVDVQPEKIKNMVKENTLESLLPIIKKCIDDMKVIAEHGDDGIPIPTNPTIESALSFFKVFFFQLSPSTMLKGGKLYFLALSILVAGQKVHEDIIALAKLVAETDYAFKAAFVQDIKEDDDRTYDRVDAIPNNIYSIPLMEMLVFAFGTNLIASLIETAGKAYPNVMYHLKKMVQIYYITMRLEQMKVTVRRKRKPVTNQQFSTGMICTVDYERTGGTDNSPGIPAVGVVWTRSKQNPLNEGMVRIVYFDGDCKARYVHPDCLVIVGSVEKFNDSKEKDDEKEQQGKKKKKTQKTLVQEILENWMNTQRSDKIERDKKMKSFNNALPPALPAALPPALPALPAALPPALPDLPPALPPALPALPPALPAALHAALPPALPAALPADFPADFPAALPPALPYNLKNLGDITRFLRDEEAKDKESKNELNSEVLKGKRVKRLNDIINSGRGSTNGVEEKKGGCEEQEEEQGVSEEFSVPERIVCAILGLKQIPPKPTRAQIDELIKEGITSNSSSYTFHIKDYGNITLTDDEIKQIHEEFTKIKIHFKEIIVTNATFFNCVACLMKHPTEEKMVLSCGHLMGEMCGEQMVGGEYKPGDQVTNTRNACPACRTWFIHPSQAEQQWVKNNGGPDGTLQRLTDARDPILCCGIDEKEGPCLKITEQIKRGPCGPADEPVLQPEAEEGERHVCQDCKDRHVKENALHLIKGFQKCIQDYTQGDGGFWYPSGIHVDDRSEDNAYRPCPGCMDMKSKGDGCGHMTCTSCNTHFCWCCGAQFETGNSVNVNYEDEDEYKGDPYEYTDAYQHLECVFRNFFPTYAEIISKHVDGTLKTRTKDELLSNFVDKHNLFNLLDLLHQ